MTSSGTGELLSSEFGVRSSEFGVQQACTFPADPDEMLTPDSELNNSELLPVLLEVDVPLELDVGLVGAEAAGLQQLDDAGRLGVDPGAGLAVLVGHPDHLRVAAKVNVRVRRVERAAEPALQLAAGDQVLDVHLAPGVPRLAGRHRQVGVVGVATRQLLVGGEVAEVLAVADAAGREDGAAVAAAE